MNHNFEILLKSALYYIHWDNCVLNIKFRFMPNLLQFKMTDMNRFVKFRNYITPTYDEIKDLINIMEIHEDIYNALRPYPLILNKIS